jgi:hypothetical protein
MSVDAPGRLERWLYKWNIIGKTQNLRLIYNLITV